MAVFNPGNQDLTGDYANIINALNQRARIESTNPGKYGTANAIAAPAASYIENQTKLAQAEEMKKREEQRQFENDLKKEGRKLFTPEIAEDLKADHPDITDDDIAPFLNTYVKPDELTKHIAQKQFSRLYAQTDPEKAAAINAGFGKEVLQSEQAFGNLVPVADSTSPTGYFWGSRKKNGEVTKTNYPAPKEAVSGKGSSMLTPERRTDELSKQYEQRVKDIQFTKIEDAYNTALRSEKLKTPTSASDAKLQYAYAKMLQPTGVLSDQDFRTAVNNGSYGEEFTKAFNKIDQGQVMADSLRKKIISEINAQYEKSSNQLKGIEEHYTRRSSEEGLNVNDVVRNVRTVEKSNKENEEAIAFLKQHKKVVNSDTIEKAKSILKKQKINEEK